MLSVYAIVKGADGLIGERRDIHVDFADIISGMNDLAAEEREEASSPW